VNIERIRAKTLLEFFTFKHLPFQVKLQSSPSSFQDQVFEELKIASAPIDASKHVPYFKRVVVV
jgi:hypothetical protein